MTRERLVERHTSVTADLHWESPGGAVQKFVVTFGLNSQDRIKEVFCSSSPRAGSDLVAFANDACILLSRLLQHGEHLQDLITTLGENRAEGQKEGPPASVLGAIVRKGVEIERGPSEL